MKLKRQQSRKDRSSVAILPPYIDRHHIEYLESVANFSLLSSKYLFKKRIVSADDDTQRTM